MAKVKLESISGYARHYNLERHTVYSLIEKEVVNVYVTPKGTKLLSLAEKPIGVKSYGDIRQRRVHTRPRG